MAMSLSHSAEAYINAEKRLWTWTKRQLAEALSSADDRMSYSECLRLPKDILVNGCMYAIDDTNTCDNSGTFFWIDPEGYYTVSVDSL